MTDDEKFYLAVARVGYETVKGSGIGQLMQAMPERGFLYLFDIAYGMGFAGAQKMLDDGIDIQTLSPRKLSLIPKPTHEGPPAQ